MEGPNPQPPYPQQPYGQQPYGQQPYGQYGQQPYAPMPPRKSWWGRNWKWFVPVVVLIPLLCLGSCFGIVAMAMSMVRNADVTKTAIGLAKSDDRVVSALGTPIEESWFMGGTVEVQAGGTGTAEIVVPLSGPKGTGVLNAEAKRSGGEWTYHVLEVTIGSQTIDLLSDE